MHDWDGGAEKISLNVAKSLEPSLLDSTVCCLHHLPQLKSMVEAKQKFSMPEKPGLISKIRHFLKIRKLADESDVVIGTLQLQSVLVAGFLAPGKTIAWIRNDLAGKFAGRNGLKTRLYKILLGWALNRSRFIVCVSEGVANSCAALWPNLAQRIKVLWNPSDIEKIRNDSMKAMPNSYEACFKKPVILGVGRLEEQKNFSLLIKACSLLKKRGLDFNLCIVGRGTKLEMLEKFAKEQNMEEKVFFSGYQGNPYAFMSRSTVMALSSRHEGFGNVLVEALSLGTPIVATNCPSGPAEILEKGKYGTLVPMNDPEALADALEEVLKNPPDAAKIEAGKKRAEDFSLENAASAWQKLILETAENRPNY